MDRTGLVKKISEETGIGRKEVRKVIKSLEDTVMEVIASEDFLEFSFAKIEGITKPPRRITGVFRSMRQYQDNNGWSVAKIGSPKCTFSQPAKDCLVMAPKKYFDMPEHRYTTKAYEFRKENKIEEIPEYKDLPEEKIKELCDKADLQENGINTVGALLKYRRTQARSRRYKENSRNALIFEDIQKQLDAGVPKDQIVFRDVEEILAEYYEREKEKQNSYAKAHPKVDHRRDVYMQERQFIE